MGRHLEPGPVHRETLRRRRLRAEGKCVDCMDPAYNGGSRCQPCGLRLREESRIYKRLGTNTKPDAPLLVRSGKRIY
jgi:hypothetical protein